VVEGAIRAEETAPAGGRYVLAGHWASNREVAALVEEITGSRAPGVYFPLGLARVGAVAAETWGRLRGRRSIFTTVSLEALSGNRYVSHARATRELGYQPRSLRQTLVDTLLWFQQAGHLKVARSALPE